MTGDGVNDVLALKEADIGIAMGSGSPASRAAAQLVLLDGNFATLPIVVDEGRRVINNVERVANLFLTKTTYAMLIAVAVGVASLPFPFLPRHLTLVGGLTIGIPGFFLALAPNHRRASSGFVSRVLKLAIPAGALAATGTFLGYALARSRTDLSLDQARTTATVTLVGIGLFVLLRLARPLTVWRAMLVAGMAALFALVLALPFGRTFFALSLPPPAVAAVAAAIVAVVAIVMNVAAWAAVRYRTPYAVLLVTADEAVPEASSLS
jgi:cation-transporting ATPase E